MNAGKITQRCYLFFNKKSGPLVSFQLQLNRPKSCLHNRGDLFPPVADPFPAAGLAQGLEDPFRAPGLRKKNPMERPFGRGWQPDPESGTYKAWDLSIYKSAGMILRIFTRCSAFQDISGVWAARLGKFSFCFGRVCLKGLPRVKNATANHMWGNLVGTVMFQNSSRKFETFEGKDTQICKIWRFMFLFVKKQYHHTQHILSYDWKTQAIVTMHGLWASN